MAFELSNQSHSPSPIDYDRSSTSLSVVTIPGTIIVPEASDDEFVLDSIKHPLSPRSAFNILAKHGENLSPATTLALAQATAKSAIDRSEAYELRLRTIQQQQNKATVTDEGHDSSVRLFKASIAWMVWKGRAVTSPTCMRVDSKSTEAERQSDS